MWAAVVYKLTGQPGRRQTDKIYLNIIHTTLTYTREFGASGAPAEMITVKTILL